MSFLAGVFFGLGFISAFCVSIHLFLCEFNFHQYSYPENPAGTIGIVIALFSFGMAFWLR